MHYLSKCHWQVASFGTHTVVSYPGDNSELITWFISVTYHSSTDHRQTVCWDDRYYCLIRSIVVTLGQILTFHINFNEICTYTVKLCVCVCVCYIPPLAPCHYSVSQAGLAWLTETIQRSPSHTHTQVHIHTSDGSQLMVHWLSPPSLWIPVDIGCVVWCPAVLCCAQSVPLAV